MIDFNEIKNPNDFELFSRDFFSILGYEIIENPSEGVDDGKDLIISKDINSITKRRWLVSCKHYAKSEKSISKSIEQDIIDRLVQHNCEGFMMFYSTMMTTGLRNKIKGFKTNKIKYFFDEFDGRKIESTIIGNKKMDDLFKRFFPLSYNKYIKLNLLNFPENLFNFYLQKNQFPHSSSLISILMTLSNYSMPNVIKDIIKHDTLEDLIKSHNIKFISKDYFNELMYTGLQSITYENPKKIKGYTVKMWLEELFPKEMKYRHSYKVNTNIILSGIKFYLYPNYFFISKEYKDSLDIIFNDMKKILL